MTEARKCGAIFEKSTAPIAAATFPLAFTKPAGGTIVGVNILCGTHGDQCASDVPSGQPVTLHAEADPGYTLIGFVGECNDKGETIMTAAKTCGATFQQTTTTVANNPEESPRPRPRLTQRPEPPPPKEIAPAKPETPKPVVPESASAPPGTGSEPAATVTSSTSTQAPPPAGPVNPAISADEHAKQEIQVLVTNYCSSLETLQPERVKQLWPLAPVSILRDQFRQYKTLKCTITSPPKFERLDASDAGGAQVKFDVKEVIEMRSGGAPKTLETTATMVVSRMGFQRPWLIDRVRHDEKPKG
jgi:hypothetical protein